MERRKRGGEPWWRARDCELCSQGDGRPALSARRLHTVWAMLIETPSKVSEVMTREVASLDESDTLSNLREAMRAMRFRHMPVTDENRLIGLVTERDLLRISTSSLWPHQEEQDRALGERFRVRDIMVRDVLTVSPETSLAEAGRLLLRERIDCLPVVDKDNVLVGILTSSDYIRVLTDGVRTS